MGTLVKALADQAWYFNYDNLDKKVTIMFAGGTVVVRLIEGGYSTEFNGVLVAHLNVNSVLRYMNKMHSQA